jgi:dihydroorotase
MRFDLLIKGGEVVDPAAGYSGKLDVAVKRRRIAAVETDIPAESAFKVIDATGQYVTPGLIDLHAHVYEGVTYWGVNADAIGSQTGVTTWVDAGSAGAVTLAGLRDFVIEPSRVRIHAFVNISYIGLVAEDYELSNNEYCNVELLERVVNGNRDIVAGIKVRAGRSGGALDLVPFHRARRAADHLELPLMLHLSMAPPDVEEVLGFLKPGDVLSHCFTGATMKITDDRGKLLDSVRRVWEDGVVMDLAHGAGSFSFEVAEPLVGEGYWPDVISTDLHQVSLVGPNLLDTDSDGTLEAPSETEDAHSVICRVRGNGEPAFSLLTCMDKMLCLGMSFPDAIRATTSRPAEVLGLQGEVGTLAPGACADISLFVTEKDDFEFYDTEGNVRRGKESIRHTMTILDARPFEPMEIGPPPVWVEPVGDG